LTDTPAVDAPERCGRAQPERAGDRYVGRTAPEVGFRSESTDISARSSDAMNVHDEKGSTPSDWDPFAEPDR